MEQYLFVENIMFWAKEIIRLVVFFLLFAGFIWSFWELIDRIVIGIEKLFSKKDPIRCMAEEQLDNDLFGEVKDTEPSKDDEGTLF